MTVSNIDEGYYKLRWLHFTADLVKVLGTYMESYHQALLVLVSLSIKLIKIRLYHSLSDSSATNYSRSSKIINTVELNLGVKAR